MEKVYVVQWRTCWKLEVMREERKIWVRYEDLRYQVKNNTLLASGLPCSLVYRNATSWKHRYRGCLGSSLGIILMVKIPSCHSTLNSFSSGWDCRQPRRILVQFPALALLHRDPMTVCIKSCLSQTTYVFFLIGDACVGIY